MSTMFVYFGCQLSTCFAKLLSATNSAGSPCATRFYFGWYGMSRNLTASLDYFVDAIPLSGAQVQLQVRAWFQQVQRLEMGICQVVHVDIVADTGSIRRGVVVAKDTNMVSLAQRGLKHDRDQMTFRIVVFTDVPVSDAHPQH